MATKVVRKFNYYRFFIFIVILLTVIIGPIVLINKAKHKKTYDYKLSIMGYNEEEIKVIKSKLNNKQIDKLLDESYSEDVINFLKEKYYIYDNLDKYLAYKKENKYDTYELVVAIINTEANVDWMEEEKETDTSKGNLMLVNRLYGLNPEYEVEDIVKVPSKYAYDGVKVSESIMDSITRMIDDAKEAGYTFVLSDGYRSYKEQESIYNKYKNSYGIKEADQNVARPGHSEYETGLSFNIVPYNKVYQEPKESDEYNWLSENAYKYGFIFRFPEDKTKLTGFDAFTWRLRYVGEDAANTIKSEGICFEEYYAYFVNGGK